MTRRMFLGSLGAAAATQVAGAVQAAEKSSFMRAYLVHFGFNSWYDVPLAEAPADADHHYRTRCCADFTRFDEKLWRDVSARLPAAGVNTVIIDLGEIMKFPSHPELAVKGSWEPERMKAEITRLRGMGFEVVPKLNFSAAHDSWLKDYHRMLSSKPYYKVCADVIKDVAEVFCGAKYFHLGYDEETAGHQARYRYSVVRQGDLWWHDFLWFVSQTEKLGLRPWIWSDYYWAHREEFLKRMPRSVLQSNWYYAPRFDLDKMEGLAKVRVQTYIDLDKAGFDQVPTGSTYSCPENFPRTLQFCREHLSPEHFKGVMMASWARTFEPERDKLMHSVDVMETAK